MRVLVCGSNYGRVYVEAIRRGAANYTLAGILARGSARSQLLALAHGVPFYCGLEGLDSNVDFACAALGTSGSDVVLGLLARGVHVLCEHPQKVRCLESALDAAASKRRCFHINGHFANLSAATVFIDRCRRESSVEGPSFFEVTVTDRSMYAALDLLGRIRMTLRPFAFQQIGRSAPFVVVQGAVAGVSTTWHIQRNINGPLPDGSPDYLVDHRIVAGFPSGILTLLSMNGPVVWNANLNGIKNLEQPIFTLLHEDRSLTTERLFRQRIDANLTAMDALARNIYEGVVPAEQEPRYLLEVSRAWEGLTRLF
jgi:thiazolinyl imide reductase